MLAEDFPEGYPSSAFVVYQISAQVGRGFAARFDFPDAQQLTTLGETIAEGQAGSGTSNFPANTVMAQRYDGVRPGALGFRLPRQLGQRQHAHGPVRRQCGRSDLSRALRSRHCCAIDEGGFASLGLEDEPFPARFCKADR
jgi:hypothetical protein